MVDFDGSCQNADIVYKYRKNGKNCLYGKTLARKYKKKDKNGSEGTRIDLKRSKILILSSLKIPLTN